MTQRPEAVSRQDCLKEKEAAIYGAALRLMAAGADLRDVKVQQIAEEAGIGKGTVYEYFSSKEKILCGLADYCLETETARLRAALDPCVTLAAMIDAIVDYLDDVLRTRLAAYRILAHAVASQAPPDFSDHETLALRALLADLVRRLQAAGEIDPAVSVEYSVFTLCTACAGCLIAGGCDQVSPPPGTLQNIRTLLLRALAPQGNLTPTEHDYLIDEKK